MSRLINPCGCSRHVSRLDLPHDQHDWRLVIVAGTICFLASLVAVNLFHRALATGGRTRAIWIAAAGIATGCGIWATHFIAMLAYDPGIGVAYNVGLTSLSLIAAAAVTGIGIAVAVYLPARWGAPIGGGIVGAGVAAMHYTGMSAVELPGRIVWSTQLVIVSIALGMLLGMAALTVAARRTEKTWTFAAALLLTLAIVSHHFTAMGAVEVVPDPTRVINAFALSPTSLALAIAGIATAILSASLAGAFVDGRVARAESPGSPPRSTTCREGLCMFDASARLILCNDRYIEMYGLPPEMREARRRRCASCWSTVSAPARSPGDPDEYVADMLRRLEGRADPAGRPGATRRNLHLRFQPADAGRRLGRHPSGHHRAPPAGSGARRPGRPGAAPGDGRCGDRGIPPAHRGDAQDA